MFLKHLELVNFRNYAALELELSAPRVILLGDNAQGKTTLLEAVGLLATGHSPTATKDGDMIRWGAESAIIRSRVERAVSEVSVDMLLRPSGRRAIRINGLAQKRLADLFGKVLVVLFRSEDLQLVKGGPAERRGYMDTMLVQLSPTHYQHLHDYQRVLTQRNHLLRAISERRADVRQLEGWDEQLAVYASAIWRKRVALVAALGPAIARWHERIAEKKEQLSLRYLPNVELEEESRWGEQIAQALAEARPREIARGLTLLRPHRDDLELLIDGHPARQFGSQGQQRTVVLALKLAELDYVRDTAGEAPMLLLDDVLAELDVRRQNALLGSIGPDVQTFVTSTHLNDFNARWLSEAVLYQVEHGHLLKH